MIPGPTSLPLISHTVPFLRDPYGTYFRLRDRYDGAFRLPVLGQTWIVLPGPEAIEAVMTGAHFSTKLGLRAFAPLFSGGLLHLDEDHRAHRRILQVAFRSEAMRGYLARLQDQIGPILDTWPPDRTAFEPLARDLTLRQAAHVFMGLTDDAAIARFNRLFQTEIAGTTALIRRPLPLTRMGRAVAARRTLADDFRALIAPRRAEGGSDLFSRLCVARDEAGATLTDDEIVDHFNFFLAAAHDATTTALTVITWALARDPTLQDRLRAEVDALPDGPLSWEDLPRLDLLDRIHKEALRRFAPSAFTARRVLEGFDWQGHHIPAGRDVVIALGPVMMDPDLWPDPARFDPDRHLAPPPNRYAWAPYGGGAHKCIGIHFAVMQLKVIVTALLRRRRIALDPADDPAWRLLPTPGPKNGLPLKLPLR